METDVTYITVCMYVQFFSFNLASINDIIKCKNYECCMLLLGSCEALC